MGAEILRIVDTIHRDRDIDKELIFLGIESALLSAARKRLGQDTEVSISINRETGEITALRDGERLAPTEFGRIAALTAKQIIMQKIKEAERDVIFTEFEDKVGHLVTGAVSRFEGPNVIVNIAKAEGILPRREQIYSESYQVGDRMKFYVREVRKAGQKVAIELSRTHPDLIRLLFQFEIPEIAENLIGIRALAREPGYRAKIAVHTNDPKVDCVGACVGVRGSRIKSIVDELGGEKIDIVRWSEDPAAYIIEALKPAEITEIMLDEEEMRAQVLVREGSLSKAIGRRGKNVRLASKLTGWEIDIIAPEDLEQDKEAPAGAEEGGDAPAAAEGAADETAEAVADETAETAADETAAAGSEDTGEASSPEEGPDTGEGEPDNTEGASKE